MDILTEKKGACIYAHLTEKKQRSLMHWIEKEKETRWNISKMKFASFFSVYYEKTKKLYII